MIMKNIVVLVSGGGTNLQALIDAQESGIIAQGKITCVISSKPGVFALERAKKHNIKTRVIARKEYSDSIEYSKAILAALNEEKADLVIYAGFMTILDDPRPNALADTLYDSGIITENSPLSDNNRQAAFISCW